MLENLDTKTSAPCKHKPPAVIVDATGRGYQIRCLECNGVGPHREDSREAWADLEDWRYEEANLSGRRTSLY
jgi:hypothetical protein